MAVLVLILLLEATRATVLRDTKEITVRRVGLTTDFKTTFETVVRVYKLNYNKCNGVIIDNIVYTQI